jgi:hypothetical protein
MAQFFEGTPALLSEPAPVRVLRTGVVTITDAVRFINVPDARITTSSVIVCMGVGAKNTGATVFCADNLVASTGFDVVANAVCASTTTKEVRWAILGY